MLDSTVEERLKKEKGKRDFFFFKLFNFISKIEHPTSTKDALKHGMENAFCQHQGTLIQTRSN